MTIWILAVLLVASVAALGLRQGAIRVAFSFVGIVLGAFLATPLAHLVQPGLVALKVRHTPLLWLVPPVIVFVAVLLLFKLAGLIVHKKVEMYYKYKADDLRRLLWKRLNHRLGLCLGLANGAAYLVLISFAIYIAGYWTVQLAASDGEPKGIRLLNQLATDLESTGMARVGRAIDRMPAYYYDTADLAGILRQTPLLEARLYRYPAFLSLAETPDFQSILNDKQFTEAWQRTQTPILDLLKYPSLQSILNNPSLLDTIWAVLQPNLQDLGSYLTNGVSPKFDSEHILGRWNFNANGTMALLRRMKPNISSGEMSRLKKFIGAGFAGTTMVAMIDQRIIIKNYPLVKIVPGTPPTTQMQTLEGQWRNSSGKYDLNYSLDGNPQEATVELQSDRLAVIPSQGLGLVFQRED